MHTGRARGQNVHTGPAEYAHVDKLGTATDPARPRIAPGGPPPPGYSRELNRNSVDRNSIEPGRATIATGSPGSEPSSSIAPDGMVRRPLAVPAPVGESFRTYTVPPVLSSDSVLSTASSTSVSLAVMVEAGAVTAKPEPFRFTDTAPRASPGFIRGHRHLPRAGLQSGPGQSSNRVRR